MLRLILLSAILLLAGCGPTPPPNDATMLENFQSQRDRFETLVIMFLEDTALEKVARSYTRPEQVADLGVTEQRLAQYRELLQELNLLSIEHRQGGVSFTAYVSSTFPDDGTYKGYIYFPNEVPAELLSSFVESLDGLEWHPDRTTDLYRRIDEHWYLWFLA